MQRKHAFTLIELLVVISIIALLIGILLPALGAARRAARQMQNSGQIRGIHTGMSIYAQGNNGFFPGRTAGEHAATKQNDPSWTGFQPQDGMHVQSRFRELLEDRYFTGEYAIAPTDRRVPWTSGNVLTEHYSYAMLNGASGSRGGGSSTYQFDNGPWPNTGTSNMTEWSETTNSEAVVLSDRAIMNHGSALAAHVDRSIFRSVHTQPEADVTDWRGSVGWNDGHTTFENTHILRTRYGTSTNNRDHLFEHADGNPTTANAAMIWFHRTSYEAANQLTVRQPFATGFSGTSSLYAPN